MIILNNSKDYKSKTKTAQIIIVIDGDVKITEGDTALNLKKGDAVVLMANSHYGISASKNAILYKATAP